LKILFSDPEFAPIMDTIPLDQLARMIDDGVTENNWTGTFGVAVGQKYLRNGNFERMMALRQSLDQPIMMRAVSGP